MVINKWWNQSK